MPTKSSSASHQRKHYLQPNKERNVSQKLVWGKHDVILGDRGHNVRMRSRSTIVVLPKRVVHPYELYFVVYRNWFGQRFELHGVFVWSVCVEIYFTSANRQIFPRNSAEVSFFFSYYLRFEFTPPVSNV